MRLSRGCEATLCAGVCGAWMEREMGEPAAALAKEVPMRMERRVGLPGVGVGVIGGENEEEEEVKGEEQSA